MKKLLALFGGAAYTASPIDVIPDFIIGLGQLDDLAVIGLVLAYVILARGRK